VTRPTTSETRGTGFRDPLEFADKSAGGTSAKTYGVLDERHPTWAAERRAKAEARAVAILDALVQDVTDPAGQLASVGVGDAR
jgi:hypothetical protein